MSELFITSPQNERVKAWVELRKDGNARREQRRFFLEGRKGVQAALDAPGAKILELIYCDLLLDGDLAPVEQAQKRGIETVRVSKDVFKKAADVMEPQGLAAIIQIPDWKLEDVLARPQPLFLVSCGLQDPGNLGTLIRSCEASGATGLIALEGTADPYNAKVVRSTAGALLTLPVLRLKTEEFLAAAKKHKIRIAASAADEGQSFRTFDWSRRPIAICIGSEGSGLPIEIEAANPERVTIPMRGGSESLNAAVAGSLLLFEAQK